MSLSSFHPVSGSPCLAALLRALPRRAALPCAVAIGALVAGTALPLQAATTADASVSAGATLGVTTPEGLQWEYNNYNFTPFYSDDDTAFGPPTETGSGSVSWSASGSGPQPATLFPGGPPVSAPVDPDIDGAIVMNLDISASSGPTEGGASADIEVGTSFSLRNVGTVDRTVDLLLSYDFTRSTSIADPSWNTASAEVIWLFEVIDFIDIFGNGSASTTLAHGSLSLLGTDTTAASGPAHSFTVEAGKMTRVNFYMIGIAETSTTAAPIPLPAAGWLLLGGLGAFGFAARRKRRMAA